MYKLMIVDDSVIIRNRIERSLGSLQLEIVATASNGDEAVRLFKRIRDMSKETSILVISALSDRQTGLKALQYGARGFICKPFTDEQLVLALSKLIANRQRG